ncbi:MAG: pilus assembly protein [Betaproteobacteria bacterium]|nr:pilus assembly protein [Betaproteobacteria bacterium]
MESLFAKIRSKVRQAGQGMTEYIIIVAVIAIGSIAVYTYFGDALRNQTASAALSLAGKKGDKENTAAGTAAGNAANAQSTTRDLTNFGDQKTAKQ